MEYTLSLWSRAPLLRRRAPRPPVRAWSLREGVSAALAALVIVGLPAFALLAVWMVRVSLRGEIDQQFEWQIWLAGSWTLIAGVLIAGWEALLCSTLHHLGSAPASEGWDLADAQKRLRILVRVRAAFCALVAAAVLAGYLANLPLFQEISDAPSLSSPWLFTTSIIGVLYLGVTFGMGFWGVLTTIVLVVTLVTPRLSWDPFTPVQPDGIERLISLSFWTGFVFSFGNVFTPVVLYILQRIDGIGLLVGGVILGGLVLGGVVAFAVPAVHVALSAHQHRGIVLRQMREHFEDVWRTALRSDGKQNWAELESRVNVLTSLRSTVSSQTTMPMTLQALQRAAVLLVLPLCLAVVQGVVGA